MTVPSPITRADRQTSGSVATSGTHGPVVVVRRPAPRPIAASTPTVDYEQALHHRLTEREIQALQGMASGQTNRAIAAEHYLAEDTVKTHARRLFRKLGVGDRAHAVHRAWELGILRRTAR
jgi:DNA-binding NarL/FixJ family response regulator